MEQAGIPAGVKVKVFNPNTDNALILGGLEKEANAKWLLNWRKALDRSKETHGNVFQILVDEPSNMQDAEASMASDKGVPVVILDLRHLKGHLGKVDSDLYQQDVLAFKEFLKSLPLKVAQFKPTPSKSVTMDCYEATWWKS